FIFTDYRNFFKSIRSNHYLFTYYYEVRLSGPIIPSSSWHYYLFNVCVWDGDNTIRSLFTHCDANRINFDSPCFCEFYSNFSYHNWDYFIRGIHSRLVSVFTKLADG